MRNIVTWLTACIAAVTALTVAPGTAQESGPYTDPEVSWIGISGTVDAVEADQFALDYGQGLLTEMDDVVSAMPYDPLSADSFQQIEEGQYVSVLADIDRALFEESEIEANAVISLGG